MEEVESDEQNEVARYRDVAARIRGAMAGKADSGADTGRYLGLPAWRPRRHKAWAQTKGSRLKAALVILSPLRPKTTIQGWSW